jgi:hypothetical protein
MLDAIPLIVPQRVTRFSTRATHPPIRLCGNTAVDYVANVAAFGRRDGR